MLAALVLLGGLHLVRATGISKDTNYVIRQNVSCPVSGSYFQREEGPNFLDGSTCYLCFCQNNDTAACWERGNRACDPEHHRDFGKRNLRKRRHLSLGEIFLRDAARDFFNKQSPEQCKPHESSFSDGCPPVDWCIGCTVCDCDANGRWDCHVLSFCPDKNGKKQMKKRRGHPRNRIAKRQSKTSTTDISQSTKITTKNPKKPTRKGFVNSNSRRNQEKLASVISKHKINKTTRVNKFSSVKKAVAKLPAKKTVPSKNRVTSRPLYIKKNVSTVKPLSIKPYNYKLNKNNTVEVAQKVAKQFMTTMQKMMKNIDLKTNRTSKQVNKVLKKRSMPKQDTKKETKEAAKKPKFVAKPISNDKVKDIGKKFPKFPNSNNRNHGRIKRQVTIVQNLSNLYESDLKYSRNVTSERHVKANRTINLLLRNSTNSILNILHNFNNITENATQRKIIVSPDIQTQTEKKQNITKDRLYYNGLNSTEPVVFWNISYKNLGQNTINNKDVIHLPIDRSKISFNFALFNNSNNRFDSKQNLSERNNGHQNVTFKKGKIYSEISTQTANDRKDYSCKFRSFLQKLIGIDVDQYKNIVKSIEILKKPKKFTMLTKIHRLLNEILNKRNKNQFYHKDDSYYSDYDIKRSDYKKSANCKIQLERKGMLRKKVNELKSESQNILKTIGIIKGLLHILEINTNETQYKVLSDSIGSNKNIKKLNLIFKNITFNGENSRKLTNDQRIQINYIKDNVHLFIKSIGKFVIILDDVIQIAMCHNKRENKIHNAKVNLNRKLFHNILKYQNNTRPINLEKLKKIVLNYNILQNMFINQIYFILNNLKAKMINGDNFKTIVHRGNFTEVNKTDAIETNSVNIIKNIKKLKLLAESLNSQKRQKREAIDDDHALEYFLILMEYLLKRPAYPSVNDGLDLLIESIKSAPDIKLTKKKAMHNETVKTLVTRTTIPMNSFKKYTQYTVSNNIRKQKNYSSGINKNKIDIIDRSEDEEDDSDDKIEEIYRSFKSNKQVSFEKGNDSPLERQHISFTSKPYYNLQEEATTHMSDNKDNKELVNTVIHASSEELFTTKSPNIMPAELDTTTVASVTDNNNNNIERNFENELRNNSKMNNLLIDSKANIDWIEENFKEIKQLRETEIRSSTSKSLTATRTHKHTENKNDVTNEIDLNNKKKADQTTAEEAMSKKQSELLNSLDYSEDAVDSKDDRFSSDIYV